jgi:transcriptional regulator with XRE-family HTH domain
MDELAMSSSDLARSVGVTATAVWNWRNGSIPRSETLTAVAESLGVTKEFLLKGDDGMPALQAAPGTVAEIVEDAKRRIAAASGYSVDRVKLSLEFDTD